MTPRNIDNYESNKGTVWVVYLDKFVLQPSVSKI